MSVQPAERLTEGHSPGASRTADETAEPFLRGPFLPQEGLGRAPRLPWPTAMARFRAARCGAPTAPLPEVEARVDQARRGRRRCTPPL
ncbi:hypothetical protein ACFYZE_11840 [Streptomyces sp. NPDC001796]|uniref:hypothetical protein n=1 Tax=Streptomyces sp. NPDC001796 TaxID=3364609 RepID=UPI0036A396B4